MAARNEGLRITDVFSAGAVAVSAMCLALAGVWAQAKAQERVYPEYATAPGGDAMVIPGEAWAGEGTGSYARYAEPQLPPVDYWQPTWMPCQSLRTNRSLVLGHLYWGADIMGWKAKGVYAPPLVTSGGATVFGNEFIHDELRPGGKVTIGWWFDPNQYSGIEWHYFELDGQDIRFGAASGLGGPTIARPIINATTGLPDSVLASNGNTQTGSINAISDMQLTSTGIVYRRLFWANEVARMDWIAGYRHTHLFDSLRTEERLNVIQATGNFVAGDTVTRRDTFRAVSQFDGADLGLRAWWSNNGTLAVTGLAKIGLGASNRAVFIDGLTQVRNGNTTTNYANRGVLAQPSNVGGYADQDFAIVSEINVGLEWQPICFWKFSLGYNWFYWSDVVRAGDHLDTTVDLNQLAPVPPNTGVGTRPGFNLSTTSFWAHGLTAGFMYQF